MDKTTHRKNGVPEPNRGGTQRAGAGMEAGAGSEMEEEAAPAASQRLSPTGQHLRRQHLRVVSVKS